MREVCKVGLCECTFPVVCVLIHRILNDRSSDHQTGEELIIALRFSSLPVLSPSFLAKAYLSHFVCAVSHFYFFFHRIQVLSNVLENVIAIKPFI